MALSASAQVALSTNGYQLSFLFLIFLLINFSWEAILAVLAFLDSLYFTFATNSLWVTRIKEEILGLGVISLSLVFIDPLLLRICVTSSSSSEDYDNISPASTSSENTQSSAGCPKGQIPLFSKQIISAGHYLLFTVAVVHILYSFISYAFTMKRVSLWKRWDQPAWLRSLNRNPNPNEHLLTKSWSSRLFEHLLLTRNVLTGGLTERQYNSIKKLFLVNAMLHFLSEAGQGGACLRAVTEDVPQADEGGACHSSESRRAFVEAHDRRSLNVLQPPDADSAAQMLTQKREVIPNQALGGSLERSPFTTSVLSDGCKKLVSSKHVALGQRLGGLEFARSAEGLVAWELTQVWAHAWMLSLFVALFMLRYQESYQLFWISGLSVILTLVISVKLHLILKRAAVLGEQWPELLLSHMEQRVQRSVHTSSSTRNESSIALHPRNQLSQLLSWAKGVWLHSSPTAVPQTTCHLNEDPAAMTTIRSPAAVATSSLSNYIAIKAASRQKSCSHISLIMAPHLDIRSKSICMPAPTSHDVQPHSLSAHHDPAASSASVIITSSNLPHDTINVHQASTLECCGELKGRQSQQIDAIMVATPVMVHNLVSELQHYQRLKLQCSRTTLADDDRGDQELRPCASTEQMKHQAQHSGPAIHEGNQQQQQGLADAVWASSPCRSIYTSEYDCMALQKLSGESFWLGRALPLLCLINIVLVVNSLSITLSAYFVVAYGGLRTSYRWHDIYASFGPLFGVDVLLALYLGWTVVPQYALASASCGHGFGSLRRKLRAMKGRTSGDLGEEIGLSGLFMRGLESAREAVNGLKKSCAFRTKPSSSSGKEESSTSCIPSLHCATLVSQTGSPGGGIASCQTGSPSGDPASSFECKNRRKEGSHPHAHIFLLCHNKHFPLNMMSEDGKALLEIWLESLWVRAGLQPRERLKRGQAVCRPCKILDLEQIPQQSCLPEQHITPTSGLPIIADEAQKLRHSCSSHPDLMLSLYRQMVKVWSKETSILVQKCVSCPHFAAISPEVELGDLDHDEDEEVHNYNTFRVRTPKIWSLLQSIFMVLDEEGFGALTIEELACCLRKLCAGTLSMRDAMLMAMQAVHKEQTLFDVAELVTSCAFLFFSKLGAQGEAGNTITQSTLASALSNLGISSNPDNVRAMLLCMHDYPTLLHSGEVHGCRCHVLGEVHGAQQGEDNASSHIVHHESGRGEAPAVASASTYHVGNTRAGIESPPVQGGDLDVCPQHPSESRCTRSVFEVAHSDGLTASLAGSTKGHTGYFDQGDRGAGFDTAGKWKAAVCNEGGLCARSATKRHSASYSVQYSVFSAFMHHEFMQDL